MKNKIKEFNTNNEIKNTIISRLNYELHLLDGLKKEVDLSINYINKELLIKLIENQEYDLLKVNFVKLAKVRELNTLTETKRDEILNNFESKFRIKIK